MSGSDRLYEEMHKRAVEQIGPDGAREALRRSQEDPTKFSQAVSEIKREKDEQQKYES